MLDKQDIQVIRGLFNEQETKIDKKLISFEERMDQKMDEKLESLEGRMDERFVSFENRVDGKLESLESRMDEKLESLENRMDEKFLSQESSLLSEIDLVQEKANNHFARVEERLDIMQRSINGIRQDNEIANLLLTKVMKVSEEVEIIKQKIS